MLWSRMPKLLLLFLVPWPMRQDPLHCCSSSSPGKWSTCQYGHHGGVSRHREAQAQGKEVELLHNPQYALSVFHGLSLVSFQELHFHLDNALELASGRPIPAFPPRSDQSSCGETYVSFPIVVLLWGTVCLLQFRVIWGPSTLQLCQNSSNLGLLVSVSCAPAGHWFVLLPFQ